MKAKKAPAMPMKDEEVAKADSLALSGLMPMMSAAMSISRIAIHERPKRPRIKFFAARARMPTKLSVKRYLTTGLASAPVTSNAPKTARGGALMTPEALYLVNQGNLLNSKMRKNCEASVTTAR